jgi:glycosyltransferase involved in cell wall biosynthesis
VSAKVIIALNSSWNLVNFRSGIIRSLVNAGYDVLAVAPFDEYSSKLDNLGCRYIPLLIDNKGKHVGKDLMLFLRFYRLIKREQPDVFLGYTVKPNIYGSLACHVLGVPVVNNIAGLGSVFIKDNWLTYLVGRLYKISLSKSKKVFFQNKDDLTVFVDKGIVQKSIVERIPGSGVDLDKFCFSIKHSYTTPIRFLLIARMIWDKGIGEFVEAARLLRDRGACVDICLLGPLDVENPASLSSYQMDEWVSEGVIRYLGVSDDVKNEIEMADCIVLPSYYREGVPRTLLEAASVGRPIITTDAIGCREVVDHRVNGYLCKPRDALDLANMMEKMLLLTDEERSYMGRKGREKVEREFDEKTVIKKYLEVVSKLLYFDK